MKVLVTGASGFIGSAVCDSLLVRGDSVVGLTRDPERARGTNPSVVWHPWEPTLERPPEGAFEGVVGVVNLIGERIDQRWTDEAKERILESRRTATRNLVGAIAGLRQKPRVLVSQSAIGYYGDRGEAIIDESAEPGDGFAAEVVREWEAAASEAEALGLRVAIIRTGHVLDPRGGMLAQLLTPFKLGVGGPLAGGRQYVSWIHMEDEAALIVWALDNETAVGTFNATAPTPVTNRAFSRALGSALGRPAAMPVPGIALDARFGREFGRVLRGGQRVVPRRATDLGFEFRHADLDQALADLL